MKVSDLIDELKEYDGNLSVVFQPENSMYADYVGGCVQKELRAFFGEDKEVVVLKSNGQAGAV